MKPRLRASAVCEADGRLLLVRLRDPVTGFEALYPPGGGVESGERPEETARRETLEETGLHVQIHPELAIVDRYPFTWAGVEYDVTTHYLYATLQDSFAEFPKVVDATYNLGPIWVATEEALEPSRMPPDIATAVKRLLQSRSRL